LKKFIALFVLLTSMFAVAACGSSDSDPEVTPENLASAMDEVCQNNDAAFTNLGTRGLTNAAIALELTGFAEARQLTVDELDGLNTNDEARTELDKYLVASEGIITADQAIVKAAESGEDEAVNKAFDEQGKAFDARDKVANELGLEFCGQVREIELEKTGTAPPEDLNYAEPTDTIEQAADAYLASVQAGNCNKLRHTDAGEMKPADCNAAKASFKGAKIVETEQYGPVGVAEFVTADGTHIPTVFINDVDDEFRFASDAVHDFGGLRTAPEDNDADQTVDELFKAIQDDDVEAFNAVLPDSDGGFYIEGSDTVDDFSDGEYSDAFLKDVRSGDSEPVQLGINAAFAFYFLEGSENDWVIQLIHAPGGGSHYAFQGYYPIPKA